MKKETLKRSKTDTTKQNLRGDLPPDHDESNEIVESTTNPSPLKKSKVARRHKRKIDDIKDEKLIADGNLMNDVEDRLPSDGENNLHKDLLYDEYYPVYRYAVDSNNNDKYAKKRTLDEFYLADEDESERYAFKRPKNGEEFPFYARSRRNEPIPAKSNNGEPIYPPTDKVEHLFPKIQNKQTYIKLHGREIYPEYEKNNQLYAIDENGDEYCALDEQNKKYYASRSNEFGQAIEYLPTSKEGNSVPIELEKGLCKYPINKSTGYPAYEKGQNGDEVYWKDGEKNEYYGKNISLNREVYARNETDEWEIPAKKHNGVPFYAEMESGKEIYPVHKTEGQFYIKFAKKEIAAQDESGVCFYAKDLENNEKYPRIFDK